jgi:DnaJ-class molecular chaperone
VQSLYDILEVSPQATSAEIREAWRNCRRPYDDVDLESMDDDQRRQIQDYLDWLDYAWNVLSDPESRRSHDLELRGHQPMPPSVQQADLATPPTATLVSQKSEAVEDEAPSRAWDVAFWVAVGVAVVGALVYISAGGD